MWTEIHSKNGQRFGLFKKKKKKTTCFTVNLIIQMLCNRYSGNSFIFDRFSSDKCAIWLLSHPLATLSHIFSQSHKPNPENPAISECRTLPFTSIQTTHQAESHSTDRKTSQQCRLFGTTFGWLLMYTVVLEHRISHQKCVFKGPICSMKWAIDIKLNRKYRCVFRRLVTGK